MTKMITPDSACTNGVPEDAVIVVIMMNQPAEDEPIPPMIGLAWPGILHELFQRKSGVKTYEVTKRTTHSKWRNILGWVLRRKSDAPVSGRIRVYGVYINNEAQLWQMETMVTQSLEALGIRSVIQPTVYLHFFGVWRVLRNCSLFPNTLTRLGFSEVVRFVEVRKVELSLAQRIRALIWRWNLPLAPKLPL